MKTRGPAKYTLALQAAIHDIVSERAPINVRGVAYALYVRELIDSMETRNTAKVSRAMTAMRECGELDWTLIVDGSRQVSRIHSWSNPDEIIEATVRQYRKDYWQDQNMAVEVWAEKSTVHGVLQPVLDELGVTFRVMKGFGSFTSVRQAAQDSWANPEKEFLALYIGDHDPSGLYMSEVDLPARLRRYAANGTFKRIAVTAEDFHLPSFRATSKRSDPRYKWFAERYGDDCLELDAIDPNDLRQRVRDQIVSCINLPKWEKNTEVEKAEIESMQEFHGAWKKMMGAANGR